MRGRDLFEKNKLIINALKALVNIFPHQVRCSLLNMCRSHHGKIWMGIRYVLLKSVAKECGDNVSIHENVVLLRPENLKIGKNVSVHPNCYIDASGGISIGNNVSVATASIMISSTHTWDYPDIPIKYNPMRGTPITIDDDVWIGCNVKIIGPCHLGGRVICAAGSVVKGEVDEHCIIGGIPAKIIKTI